MIVKKQCIVGIVLIMLASTIVLPASAYQLEPRNVELHVWGGIGVHAIVHNKGNSTVDAKLEIQSQHFNTVRHFSVPPQSWMPMTLYQFALYRPINVTLTVGSHQLMKTGFVFGIVVFLV